MDVLPLHYGCDTSEMHNVSQSTSKYLLLSENGSQCQF